MTIGIVILAIFAFFVQVLAIHMGVNSGTQGVRKDLNDVKALLTPKQEGTPPA